MIPNIFHFIFGLASNFGGKPFSLVHYLAIKSAKEVNQPDAIYFHYAFEPDGEWWEKAKKLVVLNKVVPPTEIFGNPLCHVAHQADIIRLQVLYEFGGIYLDLDTICVKSLLPFRKYQFVIGQEASQPVHYTFMQKLKKAITTAHWRPFFNKSIGLCNAVMLAQKGSPFIERWLETYKTFRSNGADEFWSEHSVLMPFRLAKENPEDLFIANIYAFHFPIYDEYGLKSMFELNDIYDQAFVHHLWESCSWGKYLVELTSEKIASNNTTYNNIARKFID